MFIQASVLRCCLQCIYTLLFFSVVCNFYTRFCSSLLFTMYTHAFVLLCCVYCLYTLLLFSAICTVYTRFCSSLLFALFIHASVLLCCLHFYTTFCSSLLFVLFIHPSVLLCCLQCVYTILYFSAVCNVHTHLTIYSYVSNNYQSLQQDYPSVITFISSNH